MPNTTVPALSGALPAWLPTAGDAARTILHTVTRALDGMRADVERELVEHARCRRDVEALIERLITGLDDFDGDAELEGQHGPGGMIVDPDLDIDAADEPHDEADEGDGEPSLGWTAAEAGRGWAPIWGDDREAEHDGREPTSVETSGRGFYSPAPDDAEDGADQEHRSTDQDGWLADYVAEDCGGIFASFKGGKLVMAHVVPTGGRAI